jgi:hypothetical protein
MHICNDRLFAFVIYLLAQNSGQAREISSTNRDKRFQVSDQSRFQRISFHETSTGFKTCNQNKLKDDDLCDTVNKISDYFFDVYGSNFNGTQLIANIDSFVNYAMFKVNRKTYDSNKKKHLCKRKTVNFKNNLFV